MLYNSLFNYQTLYENRKAAPNFLKEHTGTVPYVKETIQNAARLYEKEVVVLGSTLTLDDNVWHNMNQLRNAFFSCTRESGEWKAARVIDRTDVWTTEVQERKHQIMEEALDLEKSAINQLEEALSK